MSERREPLDAMTDRSLAENFRELRSLRSELSTRRERAVQQLSEAELEMNSLSRQMSCIDWMIEQIALTREARDA